MAHKYGAKRTHRPPVASERAEQAALFKWLDVAAPEGLFYSATAGGDGRATRTPGYTAGLPDVALIWRGKSIWIEMKRERGGVVSAVQELTLYEITLAGGLTFVAAGWVEAARFLSSVVPMKGSCP